MSDLQNTHEAEPVPVVGNYGTRYETWEALVEAEANGYVATAILKERARRGSPFTLTVGPFPGPDGKRLATNARQRMRARYRREVRDGNVGSDIVAITVRPAWKDAW